MLGSDGSLYGTTYGGGSGRYGYGTVFEVTTNGTLTTLVSFDGSNGAYPTSALTLGNDGYFYGTAGDVVFRLVLTPAITVQPQSQTNGPGNTVTFSVSATSVYPMSYQWVRNATNLVDGGNISGATNSALTISEISDSDAASYSVVVSNSKGSSTSSIATLTVIDPPELELQILANYPLVSLYGRLGENYLLQYNTNLADTTWITLVSVSNLSSTPYQILDASSVGEPARFYRALFRQ